MAPAWRPAPHFRCLPQPCAAAAAELIAGINAFEVFGSQPDLGCTAKSVGPKKGTGNNRYTKMNPNEHSLPTLMLCFADSGHCMVLLRHWRNRAVVVEVEVERGGGSQHRH